MRLFDSLRTGLLSLSLSALACACTTGQPTPPSPAGRTAVAQIDTVAIPPAVRAAVDAVDRSTADRALDGGRHPAEMLAFFGIGPGMRVAELGAGGGYTSELLARTVGPSGVVFSSTPSGAWPALCSAT